MRRADAMSPWLLDLGSVFEDAVRYSRSARPG